MAREDDALKAAATRAELARAHTEELRGQVRAAAEAALIRLEAAGYPGVGREIVDRWPLRSKTCAYWSEFLFVIPGLFKRSKPIRMYGVLYTDATVLIRSEWSASVESLSVMDDFRLELMIPWLEKLGK